MTANYNYNSIHGPLVFLALIAFNPSPAGAESGAVESTRIVSAQSEIADALQDLRYGSTVNLAAYTTGGGERQPIFEPIDDVDASRSNIEGRKSPPKAGIMSLLVPGLGQAYNGSPLAKVGVFVGAEIAFWSQYGRFNGIGNDRISEFETFADTRWSRQEYQRYLFDLFGDSSDADNRFTHHLPGTDNQQYYEMIGKFHQFSYGWALAEGDTFSVFDSTQHYESKPYDSPLRGEYNNMRGAANDAFGSRDRMVIFALVNHLVSSVDAAIGAARHNRAQRSGHSSFSISPAVEPDIDWSIIPKVYVSYHF